MSEMEILTKKTIKSANNPHKNTLPKGLTKA